MPAADDCAVGHALNDGHGSENDLSAPVEWTLGRCRSTGLVVHLLFAYQQALDAGKHMLLEATGLDAGAPLRCALMRHD